MYFTHSSVSDDHGPVGGAVVVKSRSGHAQVHVLKRADDQVLESHRSDRPRVSAENRRRDEVVLTLEIRVENVTRT